MAEVLQILEDAGSSYPASGSKSIGEIAACSAPPNVKHRRQNLDDDEGDDLPFDAQPFCKGSSRSPSTAPGPLKQAAGTAAK